MHVTDIFEIVVEKYANWRLVIIHHHGKESDCLS